METLKPEEKTLELLATELGLLFYEGKSDPSKDTVLKEEIDEKNRTPALLKPFTQLT